MLRAISLLKSEADKVQRGVCEGNVQVLQCDPSLCPRPQVYEKECDGLGTAPS